MQLFYIKYIPVMLFKYTSYKIRFPKLNADADLAKTFCKNTFYLTMSGCFNTDSSFCRQRYLENQSRSSLNLQFHSFSVDL